MRHELTGPTVWMPQVPKIPKYEDQWGSPYSDAIEKAKREEAERQALIHLYPPLKVEVKPAPEPDPVHEPPHYTRWAIQPKEFILRNKLPFEIGSIIKYVMRYDAKDGVQDLKKARAFLNMKIAELEGQERFWEAA